MPDGMQGGLLWLLAALVVLGVIMYVLRSRTTAAPNDLPMSSDDPARALFAAAFRIETAAVPAPEAATDRLSWRSRLSAAVPPPVAAIAFGKLVARECATPRRRLRVKYP